MYNFLGGGSESPSPGVVAPWGARGLFPSGLG